MFKTLRNNKGSTLIIYVVMVAALLSMTAVVVDTGSVMVQKQRMQNAVDAAALAAARNLPNADEAADAANRYMELNGFSADDITITFTDSNKAITIKSRKTVTYTFARILGLSSTTINTYAKAQCATLGRAFNYTIFSGSKTATLSLNGSKYYVGGSVHTNSSFNANGSNITITGACEAVKTITVNGGSISIPTRIPNASTIAMPDFSETIRQQAEAYGQIYNGNKTFNGSSIDVSAPIYVNGNVTINGSKFKGIGCIFATGSITFNGSSQNMSTSDAVCIYSQTGSITLNGSAATIDGILYAPNGSIIMNGSSQSVNGRIIANTVNLNGSNIRIIGGTNELNSLPSSVVKLIG